MDSKGESNGNNKPPRCAETNCLQIRQPYSIHKEDTRTMIPWFCPIRKTAMWVRKGDRQMDLHPWTKQIKNGKREPN